MRIGFDGTPLFGPRTGVGWYTQELVEAVAEQAPNDELVLLPISWRAARKPLDTRRRPNVSVQRRPLPARALWALWDRVAFPPLECLVRCDVFHATNFVAPPSWRVPIVVTVHDVGFVHHPEAVTPAVQRMARVLPDVLRRAAGIVAVSEFTRRELLDWLPDLADRVSVVHNGSHARSVPAAPSTNPKEGPYVLMLGTLGPRKNVVLALDALAVLRRRGVGLRLVLAGEASPLLDIAAELERRGLRETEVTVTGYLDDPSVASLLNGARALVFPSLYEGFGMPLLEAMEAGLPVVGVRAGATPETVGDAALLVEPGDTEGFADAMERAAFDDETRAVLVAAGHLRATEFSWERAAAATLDIYRQVAS